jgi:hypothetical protein
MATRLVRSASGSALHELRSTSNIAPLLCVNSPSNHSSRDPAIFTFTKQEDHPRALNRR